MPFVRCDGNEKRPTGDVRDQLLLRRVRLQYSVLGFSIQPYAAIDKPPRISVKHALRGCAASMCVCMLRSRIYLCVCMCPFYLL